MPVGDFPDNTPYIGLDWFILDLLGSSMVFILIEKMFPLHRDQPVFRPEWQVDFTHFIVNHLLVGLALLIVNFADPPAVRLAGLRAAAEMDRRPAVLRRAVPGAAGRRPGAVLDAPRLSRDPVPVALPRRAPQRRVHGLDGGLAAALFELLTTRVSILGVLYVLGFTEAAMNVYIIIVGFQAVFNHANVAVPASSPARRSSG